MSKKSQCAAVVWHRSGNWGHNVPCQRNATVEEDGKYWCATHCPRLAKERQDKHFAEHLAKNKIERDARTRASEIDRLRNEVIDAVREWHDGPLGAEWTVNAAKVLRAYEELATLLKARTA